MTPDAESHLVERVRALTKPLTPQPTAAVPRLEPLPGIRAVVFDVYGTLVISGSGDIGLTATSAAEGAFAEAWTAAGLSAAALPAAFDGPAMLKAEIQQEHVASRARGVDHPEVDIVAVWQALLAKLGAPMDPDQARELALEYELRTNPVWPMPGLDDTVETLARRGMVLGIVSNAQFYTPLMLHAFLGRPLNSAGVDPRCCAFSYRQGVAKPSTAIYALALSGLAQHHHISPTEVLYIGNDVRNDIQPAQTLGCRTALFAGDARSLRLREDDAQLRKVKPDRVLTELSQITSDLLPS
ncbi:HAD family hydrolase, partial [Thiohalocapsa sp.]|uniref:HAD family hydrolase n=1 Tax=Thiohalocapsa sp. TaxID=2497641 RepID=UPI0025ED5A67